MASINIGHGFEYYSTPIGIANATFIDLSNPANLTGTLISVSIKTYFAVYLLNSNVIFGVTL